MWKRITDSNIVEETRGLAPSDAGCQLRSLIMDVHDMASSEYCVKAHESNRKQPPTLSNPTNDRR